MKALLVLCFIGALYVFVMWLRRKAGNPLDIDFEDN